MQQEHWGDTGMRCFGMLLDGRAQVTGIKQRGREATILIVINDHHDLVEFTLPECPAGTPGGCRSTPIWRAPQRNPSRRKCLRPAIRTM